MSRPVRGVRIGQTVKAKWALLMGWAYRLRGDAHRHWGNSYADVQQYWAAIEDYTRAIVLRPDDLEAVYSRGILYWREIGNYSRAVEDLTQVIEAGPGPAEVYFNRAMAYKLQRRPEHAVADLNEYLRRGQDSFWLAAAERQLAELGAKVPGSAE